MGRRGESGGDFGTLDLEPAPAAQPSRKMRSDAATVVQVPRAAPIPAEHWWLGVVGVGSRGRPAPVEVSTTTTVVLTVLGLGAALAVGVIAWLRGVAVRADADRP